MVCLLQCGIVFTYKIIQLFLLLFVRAEAVMSDIKLVGKMIHRRHTPSDRGASARQADPPPRMRRPAVL
jgi:hypothetical protein